VKIGGYYLTPNFRQGDKAMAKVSPYNTDSTEYPPEHRNVYHNHDNCSEGKKIKPQHRKNGTGGKKQCKECIKLD
jgi:hypothetical protein